MICPECNTDLKEDISFNRDILNYYKVYTNFCLNCKFINMVKIKISKEYYFCLLDEIKIKAENTEVTNKTYNQNYKNGKLLK